MQSAILLQSLSGGQHHFSMLLAIHLIIKDKPNQNQE